MNSRQEAIQKVKDGDVLGALIIPSDLAVEHPVAARAGDASRSTTTPRTRPSRQFVENTIKAQVQTANGALTKRVAKEALQLLDADQQGRRSTASSARTSTCSGLKNAEAILAKARKELPPAPPSAPSSTR